MEGFISPKPALIFTRNCWILRMVGSLHVDQYCVFFIHESVFPLHTSLLHYCLWKTKLHTYAGYSGKFRSGKKPLLACIIRDWGCFIISV